MDVVHIEDRGTSGRKPGKEPPHRGLLDQRNVERLGREIMQGGLERGRGHAAHEPGLAVVGVQLGERALRLERVPIPHGAIGVRPLPGDRHHLDRERRLVVSLPVVEGDQGDLVLGNERTKQVARAEARAADGREGDPGADDEYPHQSSAKTMTLSLRSVIRPRCSR